MKSEAAAYGVLWASFLEILAQYAPSPGSCILCLNLRPAWEDSQVRLLHQQTHEMQLLQSAVQWPLLPVKADWLKSLLAHPGAPLKELQTFLEAVNQLRQSLQLRQQSLPALWKLGVELQPDSQLSNLLQAGKTLSKDAHKLLLQRQSKIKVMQEVLDRLGLIWARAAYGNAQQGQLPRISNHLSLKGWTPLRLDQAGPLDLILDPKLQVLMISGAHGSGKSRLLESLHLACLMFQSGIPLRCQAESTLPIYTGLWMLDAGMSLQERLAKLKPLLQHPQPQRLILIDDFLANSAPGENYALGKVVLEKLSLKNSLLLISSHQPLFSRLASLPALRNLALARKGSGRQARLELLWDQNRGAGLIEQARAVGWPADVLRQAETAQQVLKKSALKTPQADKKPEAKPAPAKPRSAVAKAGLKPLPSNVAIGSWVYVPMLGLYGELQSAPDRRQRVQILCQGMHVEVPADQVVLSSRRKEKKGDISGVKIQTWSISSEACDLHGLTVDEAIPLLDKFLDTAYYQGLHQLRVVHGKGTSALRKAVHQHLGSTSYVKHFRLGHPGEGDSGVTIVELA